MDSMLHSTAHVCGRCVMETNEIIHIQLHYHPSGKVGAVEPDTGDVHVDENGDIRLFATVGSALRHFRTNAEKFKSVAYKVVTPSGRVHRYGRMFNRHQWLKVSGMELLDGNGRIFLFYQCTKCNKVWRQYVGENVPPEFGCVED